MSSKEARLPEQKARLANVGRLLIEEHERQQAEKRKPPASQNQGPSAVQEGDDDVAS